MSILASDTFTDTNGVLLEAHVPTVGVAWVGTVVTASDFRIAVNRIRAGSGGYNERQARLDKGTEYTSDYIVAADFVFKAITTQDDYIYLGARSPLTGKGGYYFGYETASIFRHFRLLRGNGNQGTSLGTWAFAYPATDTVKAIQLEVSGTTIICRVDGVAVITVTDATYAAGVPSMYYISSGTPSDSASVHIDNFSVSASVTADVAVLIKDKIAGAVSGFRLSGDARVGPGVPDAPAISWITADILFTATQGEINQAIATAAINACAAQGYAVGALDNKIILGGSVGVM